MPIYEYQCQACANVIEALQKISDAPLLKCPKCGEAALRKKVSAPAFRLKGSGWYETDFKTGNKKNLSGSGEGAGSGDSSSGAGDSKAGDGKASASKPADSKPADGKSGDSKKSA
jgi:putative FmdB family regulatory protein